MQNGKQKNNVFYHHSQGHEKSVNIRIFDCTTDRWSALTNAPFKRIILHFPHGKNFWSFAGAFAKLREVTISFVMSVRLSAHRHEHFSYHYTDFQKILYLNFFRKYAEKIQVSLKPDKDNGYFT